ncbi:unnamed protein product [Prorocentrum cordatum]|uniref:Late embryogenesis abundant protein LEA-2 subgroup domain-containing protein n=1 Tax=Prorocentrum cordatum TaxID=2364126 RepID=A0ABN9PZC8_9DINO|nr:unnamed protein product [Polarella glacialis]
MDARSGRRSVGLFGLNEGGPRPKWAGPACARFAPCVAAVGLAFLGSGVFHACLLVKFTPVYSETECGDETAMLDRFEFASSVDLGMDINVTCRNPNPYSIEILASVPGRVFIELDGKEGRFEVGTLRVLSGSSLREQGSGTVAVRMDARLSGAQTNALLPHMLEDPAVRVLMELQFEAGRRRKRRRRRRRRSRRRRRTRRTRRRRRRRRRTPHPLSSWRLRSFCCWAGRLRPFGRALGHPGALAQRSGPSHDAER